MGAKDVFDAKAREPTDLEPQVDEVREGRKDLQDVEVGLCRGLEAAHGLAGDDDAGRQQREAVEAEVEVAEHQQALQGEDESELVHQGPYQQQGEEQQREGEHRGQRRGRVRAKEGRHVRLDVVRGLLEDLMRAARKLLDCGHHVLGRLLLLRAKNETAAPCAVH